MGSSGLRNSTPCWNRTGRRYPTSDGSTIAVPTDSSEFIQVRHAIYSQNSDVQLTFQYNTRLENSPQRTLYFKIYNWKKKVKKNKYCIKGNDFSWKLLRSQEMKLPCRNINLSCNSISPIHLNLKKMTGSLILECASESHRLKMLYK